MRKRRKKQNRNKPKAYKSRLITVLRKNHMYWPPKNWAKDEAKVGPDQYKCNHCEGIFPSKGIDMDHIEDMIDPLDGNIIDGEFNWHKTITRLFVQKDGYQALCIGCHIIKTWLSRQLRTNTVPFEWEYMFEEDFAFKEQMRIWKENLK